jgi:hypothetical protein
MSLRVEKFKRRARILFSTQGSLDVHFFLAYETQSHPGPETVLDVLVSEKTFIPLEDILTNEILLVGKTEIMYVELLGEASPQEPQEGLKIPVKVELLDGEVMEGSFFSDLPPDRLRLSDYLSYTPQFILLWGNKTDHILNKARILSVKHQ